MRRKSRRAQSTRTRGAERRRARAKAARTQKRPRPSGEQPRRAPEIRALCAIAKRPEWAAHLIARRLPLEEARREILNRQAADSGPEIHTRPSPYGPPTGLRYKPPTGLRYKPALSAYRIWRERELARLDRVDGAATTAAERQRREEHVARHGYRMLVEDHGLPNEFAAWQRLTSERGRTRRALRIVPTDAPPIRAEDEEPRRQDYASILAALEVLPIPAATDPLNVADPTVLDTAVDALVQRGAACERDEATRILAWRHHNDRTDHLAAMIRLLFRDEVDVEIERHDVREAAGGFAWKKPRKAAPVGRGRPRASDFNRAVAALDHLVRQLAGKARYRAIALALLYHGWDAHLRLDWPALQRAARTALFSAQKSARGRAYSTLKAAVRRAAKRVKETLDRARREDKRRSGRQETRPVA